MRREFGVPGRRVAGVQDADSAVVYGRAPPGPRVRAGRPGAGRASQAQRQGAHGTQKRGPANRPPLAHTSYAPARTTAQVTAAAADHACGRHAAGYGTGVRVSRAGSPECSSGTR